MPRPAAQRTRVYAAARQIRSSQRGCVADCYTESVKTIPTRVDQELFEAARTAGQLHTRSAAQQIAHWARIGRELEMSPAVTHDQVARVLAGEMSYDSLGSDFAQAVVRAEWGVRIAEHAAALDFEGQLTAAGEPWAEADTAGNVVMRGPGIV